MEKKTYLTAVLVTLLLTSLPFLTTAGADVVETVDEDFSFVSLMIYSKRQSITMEIQNAANRSFNYSFVYLNERNVIILSMIRSFLKYNSIFPPVYGRVGIIKNGNVSANETLRMTFKVRNIRFSPIVAYLEIYNDNYAKALLNYGYVLLGRINFKASFTVYTDSPGLIPIGFYPL